MDYIFDLKKHLKYDDPKAQQTSILSQVHNKLVVAREKNTFARRVGPMWMGQPPG
jgi:hypothetical protein